MINNEKETRNEHLKLVAQEMMTAARTAPKAKGNDLLEIAVVTDETITTLADKMIELSPIVEKKFFLRDADNIMHSQAVVLIGTRLATQGLNCAYCGYKTCAEKPTNVPCVFPIHDLGVAVGSAASVAADHRVDSRVMYSVGVAAMSLGLMGDCHAVIAIPISCTGKSPFFDRVVDKK